MIPTLEWKCCHFDEISSLAALEVVILTTSSASGDEDFIKRMTFPFQCPCFESGHPVTINAFWREKTLVLTFPSAVYSEFLLQNGVKMLIAFKVIRRCCFVWPINWSHIPGTRKTWLPSWSHGPGKQRNKASIFFCFRIHNTELASVLFGKLIHDTIGDMHLVLLKFFNENKMHNQHVLLSNFYCVLFYIRNTFSIWIRKDH